MHTDGAHAGLASWPWQRAQYRRCSCRSSHENMQLRALESIRSDRRPPLPDDLRRTHNGAPSATLCLLSASPSTLQLPIRPAYELRPRVRSRRPPGGHVGRRNAGRAGVRAVFGSPENRSSQPHGSAAIPDYAAHEQVRAPRAEPAQRHASTGQLTKLLVAAGRGSAGAVLD